VGAPKEIIGLVNRFRDQYDTYRLPSYGETELRREFIDPFFKALGWDIDNEQGNAEAYKDVVHEDSIKIGVSTKAPDYSFRIGGVRKFFVEAKKPSVNIGQDISPAFQLRRYGWSAKLPLSILTDFEEFAVYDCRVRPEKNDKASTARTLFVTYEQYDERWDEIAAIFSLDAIRKGSFDRYAESTKKKRGTAEVDDAFLKEIEQWRSVLARNLAARNAKLSQREINFAVQKTIDRIIFLRICEDRGIEIYGGLQALTSGPKIYPRLCELFRKADDRYNSGLFHFTKEKHRHEDPDEWTLSLQVDDRVLKDIIRNLYYPESPYEFSVLGSEILGQVYEQFLGKVIRLTKGHQAKIEDKPEVKKAGGVYYTPTYIVDYIVEQTVGKLLEGKTPQEVAARTKTTWKPTKGGRPLTVLDPACGSGSFLIGAYQYLLDWYRDWYVEHDPAKHKDRIYQTRKDQWRLTTAERKRILLDHIYGVDIDPQAVEVTKLSLLLKVLEGENQESLQRQLRLFRERALPDLSDNIKCGNSLIGPDFYQGEQLDLFDEDERLRINVFDWSGKDGFREIMKSGGFDAVIGNPPYIRIQTMKEWAPAEVEFYKQKYVAASKGNYDIYVVFVESCLLLLNGDGRLGFILPHKFFNAKYGQPLRTLLSAGKHLSHIVHFGSAQVFKSATTYTCLMFLSKSRSRRCRFVQVRDLQDWIQTGGGERGEILAEEIDGVSWNVQVGPSAAVMRRLSQGSRRLKDVAHLFVGLQTDADDVFILNEVGHTKSELICESAATGETHHFERSHLKPFLKGSLDIRRYALSTAQKRLLFPYDNVGKSSLLIPADQYQEQYPHTWDYLQANRVRLSRRAKGRLGDAWYGYVYKKNHVRFEQPKILAPAIAEGACFAWDGEGKYYFVGSGGGGGGGYGIVLDSQSEWSPLYLLGILNSTLTTFWLRRTSSLFRGGYIALNRQYIEDIPLPDLDHSHAADRSRQDRLVELVEQMLKCNSQLAAMKTSQERTALSRQIEATDEEIDRLVYELYVLTDEEIRIVEEATAR
jgi:type I restriction-modification system DNA methylase subunit